MREIVFMMGGDIISFRINEKFIEIKGKMSSYQWMEWNPVGLSADKLSLLRVKYGEEWYKDYLKAEETFEKMTTEDEIADDLIKDYKKTGWRLVKRK